MLNLISKIFKKYPRTTILLDEDEFDEFTDINIEDPYANDGLTSSIRLLIEEMQKSKQSSESIKNICKSILNTTFGKAN